MAYTPRFGSHKREALWQMECLEAHKAERGPHPICNLCDQPVTPDQAWDESHHGAPKALGGKLYGVAHRKCNRNHGARVVVPMMAKVRRVYAKFIGADGPGLGRFPMQAGRRTLVSKTMRNGVQPRLTLAQKAERMRAKRSFVSVDDFSEPLKVFP